MLRAMSQDDEVAAARETLQLWIDKLTGFGDTRNDGVRAARERAQELIDAGPTVDDPFTIADMVTAALPGEPDGAHLADNWRETLRRLRGSD
jgi:hypothetical protein